MSESGELPDGWVRTTLDQVALVQGGIQKQQKRRPVKNRFPFLRVANVGRGSLDLTEIHEIELFDGELERFALNYGDLLVVEGNGSPDQLGRAAMWRGQIQNCVHQNHLIRVRPSSALDPTFLQYLWNSPEVADQLKRVASSTSGLHTLSTAKLKRVEISLPPLAEQRRIVEALEDHLSRLDVGRRSLASASARMRSLRKSLLDQAVSGELCETSGNSIDELAVIADRRQTLIGMKKPAKPVSALPHYRLPDGWTVASLDAISYDSGYGTSIKCDYAGSGAPVLRIPNVQHGNIDESDMKFALDSSIDLSAYYVAPGDLLFVRTNGSRDLIGRVGVVDKTMDAAFASYLIRFRLVPGGVDPAWVRAVVSSPLWRQFLEAAAASSAGQLNLNSQTLGSLPIPVPPKAIQRAILLELDQYASADRGLATELTRAVNRSSHLRSALLAEAFSGRLVPQDPTDEPASELLARIEAERASLAMGKAKSVRRARTTATTARLPKTTPTVPVGIQEELLL